MLFLSALFALLVGFFNISWKVTMSFSVYFVGFVGRISSIFYLCLWVIWFLFWGFFRLTINEVFGYWLVFLILCG